jgi:hypothetical protein
MTGMQNIRAMAGRLGAARELGFTRVNFVNFAAD